MQDLPGTSSLPLSPSQLPSSSTEQSLTPMLSPEGSMLTKQAHGSEPSSSSGQVTLYRRQCIAAPAGMLTC
jgi:hypothetical protein